MEYPLVTVIIATYRRQDSLRKAIESVKNQTYKNIEIIVVDDNGDFKWSKEVVEVLGDYNNVKYIRNSKNLGSAKSRNIGIKAANGKYITFLDDDDIYLPYKVENQLISMMEVNADYGITDLMIFDENEKLIEIRKRGYVESMELSALMRYHILYHMTGTDTFMFKTEYIKKIGGFKGIDIGDEFYLMMDAINSGGRFVYTKACDVKAYMHTGESSGLSSGQKKIDGEMHLYDEKMKYYHLLTKRDIDYVDMRHYAVIAFAELRRGNYWGFFKNSLRSFFKSPMNCMNLLVGRKKS